MEIRTCDRSDLKAVVDFLYRHNNLPEQYSAYCSTSKEVIEHDVEQGLQNQSDRIIGAFCQNKLQGLITCHHASDETTDCCGPYARKGSLDIAKALFEALVANASSGSLSFFFSEQNQLCQQIMQQYGAQDQGRELIMSLSRERYDILPALSSTKWVRPIRTDQYQRWILLHDQTFPESYVSGDDVIASLGQTRKVYILETEDTIRGYGVLRDAPFARTVAAEIIAVRKEDRGQGYGKMILAKMLSEAFRPAPISAVELVVEADNVAAIALYEKYGFIRKTVNCSYLYSV